jgi:transposase
MDEREQQRKIRHRLAVIRHAQEVTGNVALTCRYYGMSRPTFYKWLNRYEELGEEGLRDGSSRPLTSPNATQKEVVGKILYLRQNFHFGPQKISMYLQRYHDITISPSGVWNILKKLGISRLPGSQRYKRHKDRWKRYEKPLPGPPCPGGRQVHRTSSGLTQEALPIHGHRRLHPHPGPADLCPQQPEVGDPVPRLRPREAPLPGPDDPD